LWILKKPERRQDVVYFDYFDCQSGCGRAGGMDAQRDILIVRLFVQLLYPVR